MIHIQLENTVGFNEKVELYCGRQEDGMNEDVKGSELNKLKVAAWQPAEGIQRART